MIAWPQAWIGAASRRQVIFRRRAASEVSGLLARQGVRSVFLVTGGDSFVASGASRVLGRALARRQVRYAGVRPNPVVAQVEQAVLAYRREPCDVVLGVGGGSVLDVAKVVAALSGREGAARDYLTGVRPLTGSRRCALVLIPTTAGSGSEATRFATVYVDGRKHSLDHVTLLPDLAIIDPELTWSQPPQVRASSALDAVAHAVESYWARASTHHSRQLAHRALRLSMAHLVRGCLDADPAARIGLCAASHLAGRAIDISRTTGAHAAAYPLTVHHGVSHGLACALGLSWLIPFNAGVTEADVVDVRGAAFVRERVDELLSMLGARSGLDACDTVLDLVRRLALPTRLPLRQADLPRVALEAIGSGRAENNPRRLQEADVEAGLRGLV